MSPFKTIRRAATAVTAVALLGATFGAGTAAADVDPVGCTQDIRYDPRIPTWDQFYASNPGTGAILPFASGVPGRSTGKNTTGNLQRYMDALVDAAATTDRVRMRGFLLGQTELGRRGVAGRDIKFWALGTPDHITNVDSDAKFLTDVRSGAISRDDALDQANDHPAFAWITATPHGNEPAAGEAIVRQTYELVARTDCANLQRIKNLTTFLMTARNPDGRDNNVRTSAFAFDHNRDFGTRNQSENAIFLPVITQYPGVFFIDGHQQSTGYFFPPNEDPVHHEIPEFSLNFIQDKIGPTLQKTFNDQSSQYQNYNAYDMFAPEFGDSVPSLIMGAAGMTYEKGVDESYSKQVYDHYLAMDTTLNLTSKDKRAIFADWLSQWEDARAQGRNCELEPNQLVSPLHDQITQQPRGKVCGYFLRPDEHTGDIAALVRNLQEVGVDVYRFDGNTGVNGLHEYGFGDSVEAKQDNQVLPAGTLWIPLAQGQKHWVQAIMGEDPFIPYNYFYDVVTWSYGMQRGLAGSGYLTENLTPGVAMTKLGKAYGRLYGAAYPDGVEDFSSVPATPAAVYAFNTDSARGQALVIDLLAKGVNVSRATTGFTAGEKRLNSGAALVDGGSLSTAGADLAAMAKVRQTRVVGLPSYPVARQQLVKPKIGLYSGTPTVPSNPLTVKVVNGVPVNPATNTPAQPGTTNTGQCGSTTFCQALHALTQKLELPESVIVPVSQTDINNGVLRTGGFTALINPGLSLVNVPDPTPPATTPVAQPNLQANLQDFVNNRGLYIGTLANGITAARTAGITNVDTTAIPNLITPGSMFDATFNTTNPVGYGFDRGGWIYRDGSGNPVINPATLAGSGPIPNATAVVSYGGTFEPGGPQLQTYGYQVNAVEQPGGTAPTLDGRPAVVDQPFGEGHATLVGFDPFYRSWREQDERLVLNAVLYPLAAPVAAAPASRADAGPAPTSAQVDPVAAPVAKAALPSAKLSRPVAVDSKVDRDVRITVKKALAPRLKLAVKLAKLSKAVRKKVRYVNGKGTVTLVIKGVRTSNEHTRQGYMRRLLGGMNALRIPLKDAQI